MTWHNLMLGSGGKSVKRRFGLPGRSEENTTWVTLDRLGNVGADVRFDLNRLHSRIPFWNRLPFRKNTFDEIHAYEVLEHVGRLGDYEGFFREFNEYWRVLKFGGYLIGTSPNLQSPWLWGDPGHTRTISRYSLNYLRTCMYEDEDSSASPYRHLIHPCWWEIREADEEGSRFLFCLEKI